MEREETKGAQEQEERKPAWGPGRERENRTSEAAQEWGGEEPHEGASRPPGAFPGEAGTGGGSAGRSWHE